MHISFRVSTHQFLFEHLRTFFELSPFFTCSLLRTFIHFSPPAILRALFRHRFPARASLSRCPEFLTLALEATQRSQRVICFRRIRGSHDKPRLLIPCNANLLMLDPIMLAFSCVCIHMRALYHVFTNLLHILLLASFYVLHCPGHKYHLGVLSHISICYLHVSMLCVVSLPVLNVHLGFPGFLSWSSVSWGLVVLRALREQMFCFVGSLYIHFICVSFLVYQICLPQ